MAKAFKWLLPGAVKNDNKEKKIKQNIRKKTKVQQRSDIQPFLLHTLTSKHIYAYLSYRE